MGTANPSSGFQKQQRQQTREGCYGSGKCELPKRESLNSRGLQKGLADCFCLNERKDDQLNYLMMGS